MKGKAILKSASIIITQSIITELKLQGHLFLEELEQSMKDGILVSDTILDGYAIDYIERMDLGVAASDLGDRKRHYEALTLFYMKLGFPQKEAQKKALILSHYHYKEGVPSEYSKKYSKTGERRFFIEAAWQKSQPLVDEVIYNGMDLIFNGEFNKQKSETI